MFADDAKVYKYICDLADSLKLQENCQKLYEWSEKWLMKLNVNKCQILTIGHPKTLIDYKYGFRTLLGFDELERVNSIKDLGITFDSELLFADHEDHVYDKMNKA